MMCPHHIHKRSANLCFLQITGVSTKRRAVDVKSPLKKTCVSNAIDIDLSIVSSDDNDDAGDGNGYESRRLKRAADRIRDGVPCYPAQATMVSEYVLSNLGNVTCLTSDLIYDSGRQTDGRPTIDSILKVQRPPANAWVEANIPTTIAAGILKLINHYVAVCAVRDLQGKVLIRTVDPMRDPHCAKATPNDVTAFDATSEFLKTQQSTLWRNATIPTYLPLSTSTCFFTYLPSDLLPTDVPTYLVT